MKKKTNNKKEPINIKGLRFLHIGRYMCFLFPIIFVIALLYVGYSEHLTYQQLISKNPGLTAGFLVSAFHLIVGMNAGKTIKQLETLNSYEIARCKFLLFTVFEFMMLNFPAGISFGFGTMKVFDWKSKGFKSTWNALLENGQKNKVIGIFFMGIFVIVVSGWFLKAFM